MRKPKYKPLCCVLVVPTKVVKWMGEKEVGRSRETDGVAGGSRGMARGHQLCLPADPNTLGFFATEGLKVHPTRSPKPNGNTNRNKTTENNKKEAKQLRVSWGARSKRGLCLPLKSSREGQG